VHLVHFSIIVDEFCLFQKLRNLRLTPNVDGWW